MKVKISCLKPIEVFHLFLTRKVKSWTANSRADISEFDSELYFLNPIQSKISGLTPFDFFQMIGPKDRWKRVSAICPRLVRVCNLEVFHVRVRFHVRNSKFCDVPRLCPQSKVYKHVRGPNCPCPPISDWSWFYSFLWFWCST